MELVEHGERDDVVLGIIRDWHRLVVHGRRLFGCDAGQPAEDEVAPCLIVLLRRPALKLGLAVVQTAAEGLSHVADGVLGRCCEDVLAKTL